MLGLIFAVVLVVASTLLWHSQRTMTGMQRTGSDMTAQALRRQMQQRGMTLARLVAKHLETTGLLNDGGRTLQVVTLAREQPDVLYVAVYDTQ